MTLCKFMWVLILSIQTVSSMAQVQDSSVDDSVAPAEEAEVLVDGQTALELSLRLQRYQQELARIEGEEGPYNVDLVETLSDLGRQYQRLDQHEDAISVFNRALHIERISRGLTSETQLPILTEIMSSNASLEDWESVDENHHLSWYIQSRLYPPEDKRFAEAVVEFGDWKLTVYQRNLLKQSSSSRINEVEDLSEIYENALLKIEQKDALLAASTLPVIYGKAVTEFEISNYFIRLPYQYYEGQVGEYITERVCRNVINAQGKAVTSCQNVRRLNPRYRDSQRQQKQFIVQRSIGDMEESLEKAQSVLLANSESTDGSVANGDITRKVQELEEMYGQLVNNSRSRRLR